jgi:hypothetical protein
MEAFKLLEKLSYYDDADIEVVTINDAIFALKSLVKEIKDCMKEDKPLEEVLLNIKTIINGK